MELDSVIAALIEEGVSVDQFYEFICTYGIHQDPFVQDVLHQLLIHETIPSYTETIADSWLTPSPPESAADTQHGPPYALHSRNHDRHDEFEPWSPGFQAAALKEEDIVTTTLACLRDGEFKMGKSFYCARCRSVFEGYQSYSRHRQTHSSTPASATPGPSGVRPNTGPDNNIESDVTELGPDLESDVNDDVQVGGAQEPAYRIEHTGTRRFARAVAVVKTYKVRFNDQWQGRRLTDLRRQLHGLFQELLDRARQGINDNDLLRVVLRHDALNHAIVVPLQEANDMNVEKILSKIENVLQSEENLAVDDAFQGKYFSKYVKNPKKDIF